jgi:hypothetical protein
MSLAIREPQRTSETVPLTVLVKTEVRAALEELAGRNERSVGGQVRLALKEHLARADEEAER